MTRNNDSDEQLITQIKQSLDQQASDLDAVSVSRLHEARTHALKALTTQPREQKTFNPCYLWMGGFATIVTLSITLVLFWPNQDDAIPVLLQEAAIDTALLADDHGIEFYEELDFYIWLEQKELEVNEVS